MELKPVALTSINWCLEITPSEPGGYFLADVLGSGGIVKLSKHTQIRQHGIKPEDAPAILSRKPDVISKYIGRLGDELGSFVVRGSASAELHFFDENMGSKAIATDSVFVQEVTPLDLSERLPEANFDYLIRVPIIRRAANEKPKPQDVAVSKNFL